MARPEVRCRGRKPTRNQRQDLRRDALLHRLAGDAGRSGRPDDPSPLGHREFPALGHGHGLSRRRMPGQNRQRSGQFRNLPAYRLQSHPEGPGEGLNPPPEKNRRLGRRISRQSHRSVISFTRFPCALPGLTTGYGPSHQATEDIAMFRGMPNLTIIDPCDAHEIEQIVPAIAAYDGPVYMRLLRGNVPLVLDEYDYTFELGKAKMLRDGKDALIISTGFMTMRALEAVETLRADRVDAGVLHVPTIKPLDKATICKEVSRAGRMVVVAENHTMLGGLGEAIAGLLLRSGITPTFRQIALPDEFLDAGALPTLHERYGISTEAMVRSIEAWQAQ